MGGKVKRLTQPVDAVPLDVRMNCQAKEVMSADMRRIARENGVCRASCKWGELWMEAKQANIKYNWRYRVVVIDPVTRDELFVVREGTHPTMIDIAVSMILRLSDIDGFVDEGLPAGAIASSVEE